MKEVIINTEKSYSAYIGYNLLSDFQQFVPLKFQSSKIVILTDKLTAKKYLNQIIASLESVGFKVIIYIDDIDEKNKNTTKALEIINFLFAHNINKHDLLIALGDNSIIDIVGFCASIYLRGINYISAPITLLPMIDQAIGGKTGLNTNVGKNLVGTIHHPCTVVCDILPITKNPTYNFVHAAGEMVKCGAIFDKKILDTIENINTNEELLSIICRCIRIKANFIEEDEYDFGKRKILTFGHLIGNAIEHHSNYSITHGVAVGIGCAMITKISETLGYTKSGCYDTLKKTLKSVNLPYHYDIPLESLLKYVYKSPYINDKSLDVVLIKDFESPFIFKLKHHMISNFFSILY